MKTYLQFREYLERIIDLVRKNNLNCYYDKKYNCGWEIVICTEGNNPTVISRIPLKWVRKDGEKAIEKAEFEIGLHQLLQ